jgi:hypothetical protein
VTSLRWLFSVDYCAQSWSYDHKGTYLGFSSNKFPLAPYSLEIEPYCENPSFGEGLFNLWLSLDLSGKILWNYLTMSSSRSKPSFTFFEVIWSSCGFLASFLFSKEIGSSVWKPCDPVLRLVFFREILLGLLYHIVVKLWFKIQNFWSSFEWILPFCPKPSRIKIHEKRVIWFENKAI